MQIFRSHFGSFFYIYVCMYVCIYHDVISEDLVVDWLRAVSGAIDIQSWLLPEKQNVCI